MLLTGLVLTGCAAAAPPQAEGGASPSTPSQDEQDARAFQDLYAKYVALHLDTVDEDDLTPLLTGDLLEEARAELSDSRGEGRHAIGQYTYSRFLVTQHGVDDTGTGFMVAQACLDVTGTRIDDADGKDVTPDRDPLLSMQMKAIETNEGAWRISDALRNDEVRACE
jgi:hypothetical protein